MKKEGKTSTTKAAGIFKGRFVCGILAVSTFLVLLLISIFIYTGIRSGIWSADQNLSALPHTEQYLYTDLYAQTDKVTEENLPFPNLPSIYQKVEHSRPIIQQQTSAAVHNNSGGYPTVILPCTRSGNDLLVLVNKQYKLPSSYIPPDLVPVAESGVRTTAGGMYIRQIIVADLSAMNSAASNAGIDLAILSAYRSYSTQESTYNYWVSVLGQAEADRVSARPGHSQHQLGTTVDFTTNEISDKLGAQFANTAAGRWLADNAWKYGFALSYPAGWESTTGYSYEPWHYRYIGVANAATWHNSGKILELWLRGFL